MANDNLRFVKVVSFFAGTEYEDLVTRAYKHVTRGHLKRLKGILREVRLIEDVEMRTTMCKYIHNYILNANIDALHIGYSPILLPSI